MSETTVVTDENFNELFLDVRRNRPQKGQIMARFRAQAEFVAGQHKRDIINLLKHDDMGKSAAQIMNRIHGAIEPDCYRVCREMAEDMLRMSEEEVEQKPYRFIIQLFYYTRKELVPKSKHWEVIELMTYDPETKMYKSRIEL